jgi:low temperature requirement protein LtrA
LDLHDVDNWLDPSSTPVRLVMVAVALASLLMAAALPEAFTHHGLLFACAYVGLQVGRNLGGMVLLRPTHPLGETFLRLTVWSLLAGALWLAGALLSGNQRILLWGPALLIELAAPLVWYWVPARGRLLDIGHPVEGSHFAKRCQGFIIIALGESIVVTGATAAHAGLSAAVVGALAVAFLETSALWAVLRRGGDPLSALHADQRRLSGAGTRCLYLPSPADRGRDHPGRGRPRLPDR